MNPEFEDDKIRRWRINPEDRGQHADRSSLEIDLQTEEIFESRSYALSAESLDLLADSARGAGLPLDAALEFQEGMSFRLFAKRSKTDHLLSFAFVFAGLGERHLLAREDGVDEVRFRQAIDEFEQDMLATHLVDSPLIVTREKWQRYEEDMRKQEPPAAP